MNVQVFPPPWYLPNSRLKATHAMHIKADFMCSAYIPVASNILPVPPNFPFSQVEPLFKVLAIAGTNRTALFTKIKNWTSPARGLS